MIQRTPATIHKDDDRIVRFVIAVDQLIFFAPPEKLIERISAVATGHNEMHTQFYCIPSLHSMCGAKSS